MCYSIKSAYKRVRRIVEKDFEIYNFIASRKTFTKNLRNCPTSKTVEVQKIKRNRYRALSHNEFICDCNIADLAHYLHIYYSKIVDKPLCNEPAFLKGRPIATLREDELICRGKLFMCNLIQPLLHQLSVALL